MRDSHVRHLLATWRELDDETRAHVEKHLSTCQACRAERQAFREQDILLGSLPTVRPRPAWQHQVKARIHANQRPSRLRVSHQAGLLVAMLIVFVAMSVGTVAVSAAALPGDFLYPIKRTVEQVNLIVIQSDEREQEYMKELAERRREEARRVLELKRQASLQFDGVLNQDNEGQWTIDDIPVQIDSSAMVSAGIEAGDVVRIDGMADGGKMKVLRITEQSQPPESDEPAPAPTGTSNSEPAASPTEPGAADQTTPTLTPTATDTKTYPTRTPRPAIERTVTRTPGQNVQPSRTPPVSPVGPGIRPTLTVTVTRTPPRNDQPTHTPATSPVGPGIRHTVTRTPNPTRTPNIGVQPGASQTMAPPTRTRRPTLPATNTPVPAATPALNASPTPARAANRHTRAIERCAYTAIDCNEHSTRHPPHTNRRPTYTESATADHGAGDCAAGDLDASKTTC